MIDMDILINDNECLVQAPGCTITKKLTQHHVLPKHLKPKKNLVVPVCDNCHQKLNNNDITGLFAYAYKIERITEDVRQATNKICKNISSYIQEQENENAKMS